MPVTLYASTDSGAPALADDAAHIFTLLDACLVNGYGAKPAAGWTKEFSATDKAVYRNGATALARRYFRIIVNRGASNRIEARGYYTMTDVDTGTYPFPDPGASSTLVNIKRANNTSPGWLVVADERTALLVIKSSNSVPSYTFHYLGDVDPLLAGDLHPTVVGGAGYWGSTANVGIGTLVHDSTDTSCTGTYFGGTPTSPSAGVLAVAMGGFGHKNGVHSGTNMELGTVVQPLQDGSFMVNRLLLATKITGGLGPRAFLRFLYSVPWATTSAVNDLDTATGVGALAGRTLYLVRAGVQPRYGSSSSMAVVMAFTPNG